MVDLKRGRTSQVPARHSGARIYDAYDAIAILGSQRRVHVDFPDPADVGGYVVQCVDGQVAPIKRAAPRVDVRGDRVWGGRAWGHVAPYGRSRGER